MLSKGSEEEKLESIFRMINSEDGEFDYFNQQEFSEIVSGSLKIMLKKFDKNICSSKIMAEEISSKFFSKLTDSSQKFETISEEFRKWLFKDESNKQADNSINSNSINTNLIKFGDGSNICLSVYSDYNNIADKLSNVEGYMIQISSHLENLKSLHKLEYVNVLVASEIFRRNSLLGLLNKSQIVSSFKEIYQMIREKTDVILKEVYYDTKRKRLLSCLK